ncbi:unnamed protein product [Protopolystoma xenopodis]|uniref:Uncharacterized protein n=1 Tax=Protopolystoma xenopodis TaxID=117903 RepID=A0A448XRA6_9PLAT|nr:unnamed protein product [Protopolystoma xenopodis]
MRRGIWLPPCFFSDSSLIYSPLQNCVPLSKTGSISQVKFCNADVSAAESLVGVVLADARLRQLETRLAESIPPEEHTALLASLEAARADANAAHHTAVRERCRRLVQLALKEFRILGLERRIEELQVYIFNPFFINVIVYGIFD